MTWQVQCLPAEEHQWLQAEGDTSSAHSTQLFANPVLYQDPHADLCTVTRPHSATQPAVLHDPSIPKSSAHIHASTATAAIP